MADTDVTSEPMFRAKKRRKVFRKRAGSDQGDESRTSVDIVEAPEEADGGRTDDSDSGALRVQKRGGLKKHGIAFSTAEARRAAQQPDNPAMALVPVAQGADQDIQNDRFVKPMGREVVAEDKHMMAYVDSKLAEMRSSAASPASAARVENLETTLGPSDDRDTDVSARPIEPEERMFQRAQARTDRVYQRPTRRPRKKKYERDEADIARDAYIDQFMQEAQVPIYDRSGSKTAHADDREDKDAATAEAFKAQLLADMEMNRRRPPKSASAQAANAASGPKLGGSRQQRERMRAMQEAEGKK